MDGRLQAPMDGSSVSGSGSPGTPAAPEAQASGPGKAQTLSKRRQDMQRRQILKGAMTMGLVGAFGKVGAADRPACEGDGTPLQFTLRTAPDPGPLVDELEKYPRCPYCGMDRRQWHHSRLRGHGPGHGDDSAPTRGAPCAAAAGMTRKRSGNLDSTLRPEPAQSVSFDRLSPNGMPGFIGSMIHSDDPYRGAPGKPG